MDKYIRHIDDTKLVDTKETTISRVMDRIHHDQAKSTTWRSVLRPVFIPALIAVVVLIVTFFPNNNTPDDNPVVLSAAQSEKLAEISYISSALLATELNLSNPHLRFLAVGEETEFETNDDRINLYFDTLRVYLEDHLFDDSVTVTDLTDSEFDKLIEFSIADTLYQFYLTFDGTAVTGELHVGTKVFDVTGTFEQEEDEFSISLDAFFGSDYVSIGYRVESGDEIKTRYTIQSRIQNVEMSQEIRIKVENDEAKVEITEGENEYSLKKEIEDGVTQYKLEYKINDVSGEATITEGVDLNGNPTYTYQVKEGGVEKEIERSKPDHGFDDEPGNNDNPGNGNDDEEDEEENPGNGNNPPGQQDSEYESSSIQQIL